MASASASSSSSPCAWHAWRRPDIPLTRVHAVGIYASCTDVSSPASLWRPSICSLLRACQRFHAAQFPSSALSFEVRGPLPLPFSASRHSGDGDAFYSAVKDIVTAAAADFTLPPLVSYTGCDAVEVRPTLRGGLARYPQDDSSDSPSMVVFVIFADWGLQVVPPPSSPSPRAAVLGKYFISAAAAACGGVDISDITHAGGSRSSFLGLEPVTRLGALHAYAALHAHAVSHAIAAASCSTSSSAAPPPAAYVEQRVGVGLGLVTQEAWRHVQVHGCDAVTYHEGLGHALGMPHPSQRDKRCVMDLGMYQCVPMEELYICSEIKADMRAHAQSRGVLRVPVGSDDDAVVETAVAAHAVGCAAAMGAGVTVCAWQPMQTGQTSVIMRRDAVHVHGEPPLQVESFTRTSAHVDAWLASLPRTATGGYTAAALLQHAVEHEYVYASEWSETQYAMGETRDGRTNVHVGAQYRFTELVWLQAPEQTAEGVHVLRTHAVHDAAAAAADATSVPCAVLLDAPRNIALLILGEHAFISSGGLWGAYSSFGSGKWRARSA